MPSQITTDISTDRSRKPWLRRYWWVPLGVLAAAAVVFVVAQLSVSSPSTVAKITFKNDSVYDLHITATGAARDGVVSLGTVAAQASTGIDDVIDQGDVWIFHFDGQARDGGEIRLTRAELEGGGWNVTIPDSVSDRLRSEGASASPNDGGP